MLDVRAADIGDDGHIRRGHGGQRRDLAGMVHPHLEHADLIAFARAQEGERQADVIVEIALRVRDGKRRASTLAVMSLVLVLPLLPVMPTTCIGSERR